jgi:hypothetical protein
MNQARHLNIALGVWLFISAFLWPHSPSQFTNSWAVGILSAIAAGIALAAPGFRYVNTALAVWLFVTAFSFRHTAAGTVWNEVIVAAAMFVISLIPSRGLPASGRLAHVR